MPISASRAVVMAADGPSSKRGPRARRPAPFQHEPAVRVHALPRPELAVGPLDADFRAGRAPEADVRPSEGAAAVAGADRQLPARDSVPDPRLDPRADGVGIRAGLPEAEREPVAHRPPRPG